MLKVSRINLFFLFILTSLQLISARSETCSYPEVEKGLTPYRVEVNAEHAMPSPGCEIVLKWSEYPETEPECKRQRQRVESELQEIINGLPADRKPRNFSWYFNDRCEEIDFGLESQNPISWLRTTADEFGCMLERDFGYKDPKFNCELEDYANKGDPCNNTKEYYEGPEFPEAIVTKVHPKAKAIQLTWEHGDLQSLHISFDSSVSEQDIQSAFNISSTRHYRNIINLETKCYSGPCLSIIGFDHNGAGDVDCVDSDTR